MAEIKKEIKDKKETKRIVRLATADIDGNIKLHKALRRIKGISFMLSNSICIQTGLDKNRKIGALDEGEIKLLESAIKNPAAPTWMLNRRKDPETGITSHLVENALTLKKIEDINNMRRLRMYKGVRHELGQPVRGQRTRSTFRTQKSVGVSKKAARAQPKAKSAAPAPPKKG